jgi:RNA polymerase sigma-70 factor (ECF subfamily)
MEAILQAARATWPEVELGLDVFTAYVMERAPDGMACNAALGSLNTCDLYLACACARGDAAALAVFERRCLGVLDDVLRRMSGVDSDLVEDVKQQLRKKLFVADAGRPKILEFSGRGELRRWVRVLGVREALGLLRRARRETRDDDALAERVGAAIADPELAYFQKRYQHEFANAFAAALQCMSDRERLLLRQYFVDGLTVDELGALFRVHRATAARQLARAQVKLTEQILAALVRVLDVSATELDSILRLIRSGLELRLGSLLSAPQRPAHGDQASDHGSGADGLR